MRARAMRMAAVAAALAMASVVGATVASSQDGNDKPEAGGNGVAPAAINSALVPEAKYVPVTPCRIIDTRAAGGKLTPGSVRAFDVFGTNLSGQGGSGSGCGIPSYATAVDVNVSATDAAGNGFFRGAAQNSYVIINPDPGTSSSLPNATLLNFTRGFNITSGTTIPVCSNSNGGFSLIACSGGKELRLAAFLNPAHAVVDIVGYYMIPVHATVNGDPAEPVIIRGNGVLGVTKVSTGNYDVDVSRDLRGCSIVVSPGNSNEEAAGANYATVDDVSAGDLDVEIYNNAGTSTDDDFSLVAQC